MKSNDQIIILVSTAAVSWWAFHMIKKVLVDTNKEIDLMARTIWGEARGEGQLGMQAVANVIMNRVNRGGWWGATISDVVLKPYQFSTWNESDANRNKARSVDTSDQAFWTASKIASMAYNGQLTDVTNGATHYHAKSVTPAWAVGQTPVATIGNHVFYKLS